MWHKLAKVTGNVSKEYIIIVCEYNVFSRLQRIWTVKHLHTGQRLLGTTSGTVLGV